MPRSSQPPSYDHPNNIRWGVQFTNLLIMQFSPATCHFLSLRSKYSPQHPVLKHSHIWLNLSVPGRRWYSRWGPKLWWDGWSHLPHTSGDCDRQVWIIDRMMTGGGGGTKVLGEKCHSVHHKSYMDWLLWGAVESDHQNHVTNKA
jgi:hypothetical protein